MTVAPAVLEAFRLERRLVTGDALYCQRALCRTLVARGGAYFFAVKANQPSLHDDLFWLFAWPASASASPRRWSTASTAIGSRPAALGFRGAGGLCRLAWAAPGLQDRAPSRLPRQDERGDGLRGHQPGAWRWHPPNLPGDLAGPLGDREPGALRARRDLRRGRFPGPQRGCPGVLAALRNVVLRLLRQAGHTNIAAALQQLAGQPGSALRLLGIHPSSQ